jgi:hypothetical protein
MLLTASFRVCTAERKAKRKLERPNLLFTQKANGNIGNLPLTASLQII